MNCTGFSPFPRPGWGEQRDGGAKARRSEPGRWGGRAALSPPLSHSSTKTICNMTQPCRFPPDSPALAPSPGPPPLRQALSGEDWEGWWSGAAALPFTSEEGGPPGSLPGARRAVCDGIVCSGALGRAFNGGERHVAPIPTPSSSQDQSQHLTFYSIHPNTLHLAAPISAPRILQPPSQPLAFLPLSWCWRFPSVGNRGDNSYSWERLYTD